METELTFEEEYFNSIKVRLKPVVDDVDFAFDLISIP